MKLNTDYLYDFNRERYTDIYNFDLEYRDDISSQSYNNATILPARPDGASLFGSGGVLDKNNSFVKQSGIISYGRDVYHRGDEPVVAFGGYYDFSSAEVKDETVIYCGLITNHWGHFLIDFTTRLWYALECKKDYRIAFVVKENLNFQLITNINRFLELLGISENRIVFVNKPTTFREVIVPECAYVTNCYYSKKYLDVFDTVAGAVKSPAVEKMPDKVYFTRNAWYKAQASEAGEELLIDLFGDNGFTIVSPEKCSLDYQISLIRNSSVVAAIEGTIPHNMLFAKQGQKLIIINKTYNFNSMQKDVNRMRGLDFVYVDAYVSVLPVPMGDGPFSIVFSEELQRYSDDNNMKLQNEKYAHRSAQCKNIKRVLRIARRNIGNGKIKMNYNTDKGNSAYFDPRHLTMYFENYYTGVEKITKREKLAGKINKYISLLKKVIFRIKDKLMAR